MNVNKLIIELQKLKDEGLGELKVKFDFGACEVAYVNVEEHYSGEEYIHLDWA